MSGRHVSELPVAFVKNSRTALLQLLLLSATKDTFRRIIDCPTYPVAVREDDAICAARALVSYAAAKPLEVHELLQRLYAAAHPLAIRKRHGQFFTPTGLADWALTMVAPERSDHVWDAGAGAAVFGATLLRNEMGVASYTGIENDPVLALCGALTLEAAKAPASFRVWYTNFLGPKARSFLRVGVPRPTLVVANPPFVRFHNLKGRSGLLATIKSRVGVDLSPLSGSFNYFLARAVEVATSDSVQSTRVGRIVFLLPKEAAGSAHARHLRSDLSWLGWSAQEHVIPRSLTGSEIDRAAVLALLFDFQKTDVPRQQMAQPQRHQHILGDIVAIKRGISTGCNEFFVMSETEARERGISEEWLRRIIPTRIRLETGEFSETRWQELCRAGQRCLLLALPDVAMEHFDTDVRAYLRDGIGRGLHDTATARRLRRWYSLPMPDRPPDVFVSYLFRGSPKVIFNSARVFHLTNILGGRYRRPPKGEQGATDLVVAIEAEIRTYVKEHPIGREYRDALRKIEPRELQRMPVSYRLVELAGHDISHQLVLSGLR